MWGLFPHSWAALNFSRSNSVSWNSLVDTQYLARAITFEDLGALEFDCLVLCSRVLKLILLHGDVVLPAGEPVTRTVLHDPLAGV